MVGPLLPALPLTSNSAASGRSGRGADTDAPVERYAGAAAVVTGQQIVRIDHDVPLGERARVQCATSRTCECRAGRPSRRSGRPMFCVTASDGIRLKA